MILIHTYIFTFFIFNAGGAAAGGNTQSRRGTASSPRYQLPAGIDTLLSWILAVHRGQHARMKLLPFTLQEAPELVCSYNYRIEAITKNNKNKTSSLGVNAKELINCYLHFRTYSHRFGIVLCDEFLSECAIKTNKQTKKQKQKQNKTKTHRAAHIKS